MSHPLPVLRFNLPSKEQRYANPRDDCKFWEMYRINDKEGYNDGVQIPFELTNQCDEEEFMDSQLEALGGIAIADFMRKQVRVGGFGAYLVDTTEEEKDEDENVDGVAEEEDEETKYYLVKWDGLPYQAKQNEEINGGVTVREGEWLCLGKWLYPLPDAPQWYYPRRQKERVTVRMQQVVAADVQLASVGPGNRLPASCGNRAERLDI